MYSMLHSMDDKTLHNILKEQLFKSNINTAKLDNVPCKRCGLVPEIKKKIVGKKVVVDRSSRIDCDCGARKEVLETYHVDCYRLEASEHTN